ncbi:MAG: WYL domain-containing protein [Bacteroidetes bacterium]|uniref:helix-turn-helix transcriptional regulator n=1 Tax=Phnomibacter sp. TaxID=2836217 RepID=UPI002FDE4C5D|nr:WYL domain-containing protein [Bacteroidota bacterium]
MLSTDRRRHFRLPVIDGCLRQTARRWTAKQLLEKVNAYLLECEEAPVTVRTIQKDLRYLQSLPHNPALIAFIDKGRERWYYYEEDDYVLELPTINADESFAFALSHAVLEQMSGFPLVKEFARLRHKMEKQLPEQQPVNADVLLFEHNPQLKGIEWLEPLFEAIRAQTVLKMVYQPYDTDALEKVIHPWWLKQFNQRWFLFGWNEEQQRLDNSPLDRIVAVSPVSIEYRANTSINPQQYFSDMVGVTRYAEDVPQQVTIRVKASRGHYIQTKPLHVSQQMLPAAIDHHLFQYQVIINKEWMSLLLSFGADLEVLEPLSLRGALQQELLSAAALYM